MTDLRTEPRLQDLPAFDSREPHEDQAPPVTTSRGRRRSRIRWLVVAILALAAIAAIVSIVWQPRPIPQLPAAAPRAEAPSPATGPRYPIEAAAAALPPLDASDSVILAALQSLWQGGGIVPFLEPRSLARNIVASVDNLPRRSVPANRWPLRRAEGAFGTAKAGEAMVMSDANAMRYAPYVQLLSSVDPVKLVAVYARHYPLFQQAYQELGYPQGHFNDRLVEAIDVMLATPEPPRPIRLTQPKIFYEYADRDLEALPAGQKLMLRLNPEQAKSVKANLAEIRRILTAQASSVATAPSR